MKTYTIGETTKIVGLPAKTIRFYEESGVLSKPKRLENGYRSYTPELIEEMKILKYTKDLGLPLSEVKKLLKGCENGDCEHSNEYIKSLIEKYIKNLNIKLKEMQTLKFELSKLNEHLARDCKTGEVYCCNILHQIAKGGE